MPRTHQPSRAVLRSVLTRHRDIKDANYTGVFYVGLGDRFDDERRLVREAASEFGSAQSVQRCPRCQTSRSASPYMRFGRIDP
jgi:hypothetical protein